MEGSTGVFYAKHPLGGRMGFPGEGRKCYHLTLPR